MRLLGWTVLVLACALPALLVAVALGPVTVGILCAAAFGGLVAGIAYLCGVTVGWIEKLAGRH